MKRAASKQARTGLWQKGYHDHIIRNEADYLRIWDYIDTNPAKWREDCYYRQAEGGDLIVKHTYLFRPGRWRAATWGRPYNALETCPLIRHDLRSCHLPPKGKAYGPPQESPLRGKPDRERWLSKARRTHGTAPAAIFADPGPSGPAGI